jgi:hypothetical protein
MPRDWNPDPALVGSTISALKASGWVEFTGIEQLRPGGSRPLDALRLDPRNPGGTELSADRVGDLVSARTVLDRLADNVETPDSVLRPTSSALIAPLSHAWGAVAADAGDAARSWAVDTAIARVSTAMNALSATVSEVTLISAKGSIPIAVRNGLPSAATVKVRMDPRDARLIVDDEPTVTIDAGQTATVYVPVRAIASGDVTLDILLVGSDGHAVGVPGSLTLRVRAGWETVSTFVIFGAVGIMLIAGIYRTINRGRAQSRTTVDQMPETEITERRRTPSL